MSEARAMPEPQRVFLARLDRETARVAGPTLDGDTVICECLLCHEPHLKQGEIHLRLLEVDTPEIRGETRDAGLAAKAFTQLWLEMAERGGDEWPLLVQFVKLDSFGRWLAWVWARSTGESLSEALIAAGHSERLPVLWHPDRTSS